MPVPEIKGGQDFAKFIKLPNPLERTTGDIVQGDMVTILTAFSAPTNEKLKSFLIGDVELADGQRKAVGLNLTSYLNISKTLGDNTDDWVGKQLVYGGFKKLAKGNGHLWGAK